MVYNKININADTDWVVIFSYIPVNIKGSMHCVPQPFEQHLMVPLQAMSELHWKSQEVAAAGIK